MTEAAPSNATLPLGRAPNQGPMERRNPVPVGRYWIFINASEVDRWDAWVKSNASEIQVLVTEPQESLESWVPVLFAVRPDWTIITHTEGYWILFDVLSPVPWVGLGYPTHVIDPSIKSSSDISNAPPPTGDNPALDTLATAAKVVLWGGAAILLFEIFRTVDGGRRFLKGER